MNNTHFVNKILIKKDIHVLSAFPNAEKCYKSNLIIIIDFYVTTVN